MNKDSLGANIAYKMDESRLEFRVFEPTNFCSILGEMNKLKDNPLYRAVFSEVLERMAGDIISIGRFSDEYIISLDGKMEGDLEGLFCEFITYTQSRT